MLSIILNIKTVNRILRFAFLSILLIGCSSEPLATPTVLPEVKYEDTVTQALNRTADTNPLESDALFFKNLSYGTSQRNVYDLFLPKDGSPKGVVIFFHGGTFISNDKSDAYGVLYKDLIQKILAEDIALVNANYSFLTSTNSTGIETPLSDGTLLLEHIRSLAPKLAIDINKIILSGVSSGAGIALWNGLQADHNKGVLGIVALETQSSYNIYSWEKLFTGFSVNNVVQNNVPLALLFLLFYGGMATPDERLQKLDFINFIDSSDPSLYLYNTAGANLFAPSGSLDLNVLYHSTLHTDALKAKADTENLNTSGISTEMPEAFIIRLLQ